MNKLIQKIEEKINFRGLTGKVVKKLSNSELNSLYLELFREQTGKLKPSDLLRQFSRNRFTTPAPFNPIEYKEYEVKWLKAAGEIGFKPILLSPLTPLGSSSAIGFVNQNNIVSAVRGTEVVSDATNVLALQIAKDYKSDSSNRIVRYSTAHRHVRAQYFSNPAFSAHFGAFCMVSGGYDNGNFSFETEEIKNHFRFYINTLKKEFNNELRIKIYFKNNREDFADGLIGIIINISNGIPVITNESDDTRNYYNTVRIKIFIIHKNREVHLVDMGFVDWSQKLLTNRKHRMLTSGCGLELIYKIKTGLL